MTQKIHIVTIVDEDQNVVLGLYTDRLLAESKIIEYANELREQAEESELTDFTTAVAYFAESWSSTATIRERTLDAELDGFDPT